MRRPAVLPVVNDLAPSACDRRQLLLRLGLGALLASGCRLSLDDEALEGEVGIDAGPTGPDAPVTAMVCEGGFCIDLAAADNAVLANVNGFRLFTVPGGTVIVVRTSETAFVALSANCTHQNALVTYDATRMDIRCPRHGSRFSLTGEVTRTPADRPLTVYATTFDATANTLTVAI